MKANVIGKRGAPQLEGEDMVSSAWRHAAAERRSHQLRGEMKIMLGVYNNVILFESHHIYSPLSNVRRNVLLGAQAGAFAIANPYDKIEQKKFGKGMYVNWAYRSADYGQIKGICGSMVCGMKKCTFASNSGSDQDYGVVTISAYGAQHT